MATKEHKYYEIVKVVPGADVETLMTLESKTDADALAINLKTANNAIYLVKETSKKGNIYFSHTEFEDADDELFEVTAKASTLHYNDLQLMVHPLGTWMDYKLSHSDITKKDLFKANDLEITEATDDATGLVDNQYVVVQVIESDTVLSEVYAMLKERIEAQATKDLGLSPKKKSTRKAKRTKKATTAKETAKKVESAKADKATKSDDVKVSETSSKAVQPDEVKVPAEDVKPSDKAPEATTVAHEAVEEPKVEVKPGVAEESVEEPVKTEEPVEEATTAIETPTEDEPAVSVEEPKVEVTEEPKEEVEATDTAKADDDSGDDTDFWASLGIN